MIIALCFARMGNDDHSTDDNVMQSSDDLLNSQTKYVAAECIVLTQIFQ